MITVVHLITKLEMGGAQENTLYTVEHLNRRRFRVALVHGPGGYFDAAASQLADTDVEVVPELVREVKLRNDSACLSALVRTLRRRRAEHAALGHESAGLRRPHPQLEGRHPRAPRRARGRRAHRSSTRSTASASTPRRAPRRSPRSSAPSASRPRSPTRSSACRARTSPRASRAASSIPAANTPRSSARALRSSRSASPRGDAAKRAGPSASATTPSSSSRSRT